MRNKPRGLTKRRNNYYCRIKSGGDIDVLVTLQTANKKDAYDRCIQINMYREFLISGELTLSELVNTTPEIGEWFNHNESKVAPLTIGALSKQWLKLRSVDLAETTLANNERNINDVLNVIGDINVKELTIEHIDKFKLARKGQVADISINRELVIFKAFCRWLYDRGYIDRTIKIKMIKVITDARPKYITEKDFKRLMSEDSIPQWIRNACKVYWFTGCRLNELVEGRLRGNRLIIDSDISKSGREFACHIPKSFIPMIKDIHRIRDEFCENYTIECFGAKISKQVIKGYKKIGIYEKNRTKLHSLRHSFGCRMYLITADIKEVGKMMNHKDRTST